jgi:hypothetical protein
VDGGNPTAVPTGTLVGQALLIVILSMSALSVGQPPIRLALNAPRKEA